MLAQLGCKVYQSRKVKEQELRQRLSGYKHSTSEPDMRQPLVESVEEFRVQRDGRVSFTFSYDHVMPVPSRAGIQKVVRTSAAQVAVIDPPAENTYFIYAATKIAEGVRARVGRRLAGDEDFLQPVTIPRKMLRDISESADCIEVKYAWWDDVETYAKKAALKGNLKKSRYYSALKGAEVTYLTFESRKVGRTIRLTEGGLVTFYGADAEQTEIEEYVLDLLKQI